MNKYIYFGITTVIILALGASWTIKKASSSHSLKNIKQVPNFSLINQNGDSFTEKKLKNKISVLDFMFTNCPGPCPIMSNNMNELYKSYGSVDQVQFISITVDPENDNTSQLKKYAESYGVYDERWQFLTSEIEKIKTLKQEGFMLYAGELPQAHAIKFILIDEKGNIRQYYDGTDDASMAVLRKDINLLLKEFKRIET
ncbi:MAG: SCO family protein [Candidatus Marinimicrobia bacterium]|nr:SCO family protein [Candidatus Neomarinimicrobiota bacterium]